MKITERTRLLLEKKGFKGETYVEANCFFVEDRGESLCPTLEWCDEENIEYYKMFVIVPDIDGSVTLEDTGIKSDTLKELFELAIIKYFDYE